MLARSRYVYEPHAAKLIQSPWKLSLRLASKGLNSLRSEAHKHTSYGTYHHL